MATTEEIQRRVEEADSARSVRRSAAAQQVGELAQLRAALVDQLDDIDRELGDVLVAAQEVIDVTELAQFTDVPADDLTRLLERRKATATKRKKSAAGAPSHTSRKPSGARTTLLAGQASTQPETPIPRNGTADAPAPVTAAVT
jgi:hypothetical protein